MLYTACNMQFADVFGVNLTQEFRNVESLIVCVAFKVVYIKDEAATSPAGKLIKKSGFRVIPRIIRNDMDDILHQEEQTVSSLNIGYSLANHIKCFFGL